MSGRDEFGWSFKGVETAIEVDGQKVDLNQKTSMGIFETNMFIERFKATFKQNHIGEARKLVLKVKTHRGDFQQKGSTFEVHTSQGYVIQIRMVQRDYVRCRDGRKEIFKANVETWQSARNFWNNVLHWL